MSASWDEYRLHGAGRMYGKVRMHFGLRGSPSVVSERKNIDIYLESLI